MSGRKLSILRYKLSSAASLAGDFTSDVQSIQNLDNLGIQINNLTGTATGTWAVQTSIDYSPVEPLNSGNWTTITTASLASGLPTPITFDLNQLSSMWLRVIYTRTSGTGTADIYFCGKMI